MSTEDRFAPASGGLREQTARGTIVNALFVVGVALLALVQKVVVARFLTPHEFGIWSLVLFTLLTLVFLKNAGIAERYVQQDEADQELAFRKAFTIDMLLGAASVLLIAVALPLFAIVYGRWEIVAPGLVCSLVLVGSALQAPIWIHYRRMDFKRQRTLQLVEPLVMFVVTVALAAAGASYWSLVAGAVAGSLSGALAAVLWSPYRLGFVLDRATVRDYFSFSWPVVVANGSGVLIGQAAQLVGVRSIGVAGSGAIGLGASVTAFSDGVDGIVTQTIYPAICAVRDRPAVLYETFVTTNRVALLWGVPFGLGIACFAPDIVRFVVGEQWRFATHVIQAFGVVSAIDQLAFNWHAFFRATNQTGPLASVGVAALVAFLVLTAPLTVAFGLDGFAVGWVLWGIVNVAVRTHYLRRLFPQFRVLRHAARAFAPALPGLALVGGARLLWDWSDSAPGALVVALGFVALTLGTSLLAERRLVRELMGYLRARRP